MEHRVAAVGELDVVTCPDLLRRIDEVLDAEPGADVHVDFAGVTFIDSTGLGVLVAASRRAKAGGGALRVVNLTSKVRSVFELTGLDRVLC